MLYCLKRGILSTIKKGIFYSGRNLEENSLSSFVLVGIWRNIDCPLIFYSNPVSNRQKGFCSTSTPEETPSPSFGNSVNHLLLAMLFTCPFSSSQFHTNTHLLELSNTEFHPQWLRNAPVDLCGVISLMGTANFYNNNLFWDSFILSTNSSGKHFAPFSKPQANSVIFDALIVFWKPNEMYKAEDAFWRFNPSMEKHQLVKWMTSPTYYSCPTVVSLSLKSSISR